MARNTTSGVAAREGFALVTTLLIVLVLGVIALGAAWLASGERKVSHAESVHQRALFAADSGAEAAVNFVRLADDPPVIVDFSDNTVRDQGTTAIDGTQEYEYVCRFVNRRPRLGGWGTEYVDYNYAVTASGEAGVDGQSAVQIVATRLFREGY